ncbi:MAG TPA: Ty1/Copia family ribonuclease HI, partial [Candidatus Babeliaceae bacterium]|nr:Ty1/Copia family ribonuclease HI [Candidatus Babeliaceae bacterium]
GMRILRDRNNYTLHIDQQGRTEKLLGEHNMLECKVNSTPLPPNTKLSSIDCPSEIEMRTSENLQRKKLFESLVGSFQYLSNSMRPDLTHAVNQCARFMKAPGEVHWQALKSILRYLSGTRQLGLMYAPNTKQEKRNKNEKENCFFDTSLELVGWSDSDHAGCEDERKSTSGFIIQVNGCTISWASKRQATVSISSAESEYIALTACMQEIIWFKQLIEELGWKCNKGNSSVTDTEEEEEHPVNSIQQHIQVSSVKSNLNSNYPYLLHPIIVRTDNQAAKAMCSNSNLIHSRTKHIDIRYHWIRNLIQSGEIHLEWVPTYNQLADCLTKALDRKTFEKGRTNIMGE